MTKAKDRHKFTAIFAESWTAGSIRHNITKMARLTRKRNETIEEMLIRENIADSTIFLFVGHPALQGENIEESNDD